MGIPLPGYTTSQMRLHFGPSLARESKAFKATYGDDDFILAKVNEVLENS